MFECDCSHYLTSIVWVHVRRVEAKVDEEGDGHSILEPLHHIGLAVQGVGHVASQDDVLSCTCRHKLGLLSHTVGTWETGAYRSTNPGHLESVEKLMLCLKEMQIEIILMTQDL